MTAQQQAFTDDQLWEVCNGETQEDMFIKSEVEEITQNRTILFKKLHPKYDKIDFTFILINTN